ncbi:nuclear transport factor 2 family protein [Micromonospora sp. WMMD987]|jgi:3-phenylpropionate/cinnamic acid dioxygenase small subunit|uniref:nuclear transport factor 2 family protein n=1 Tax=Micromonospora sp. WMMD987 TaxID=3016089 RepID=UPI00249BF2FC|nr:nuclear transport factor 2 family protein [Micromonospora sp. WMMD987]WFE92832.1 nuclear transport factor 2 family protein [Micromonospora sp. WMMD987]
MGLSVEDRLAIHELVALHGHLMDSGEFGRMDELFCTDVVYDVSAFGRGELRGYDAISEASLALGDANPVGHHVSNVYVSENPDGTVRVHSKAIGIYADGRAGSVVYEDVVRREATGWRIAYRKVVLRRTPLRP